MKCDIQMLVLIVEWS